MDWEEPEGRPGEEALEEEPRWGPALARIGRFAWEGTLPS